MRRASGLLLLATVSLAAACSGDLAAPAAPAPTPPAAPPPPDGLVALPGDAQVTLRWNPVAGDVDRTEAFAGTATGALSSAGVAPGAASSLVVTGLANGTTYYFAVEAVGPGGRSRRGAEVMATPFPPDSDPPGVSEATPAAGQAGVAIGTSVTVRFDEPMDAGSVSVVVAPAVDLGPSAWNAEGTEVSYLPPAPLAYATTYAIVIDGADLAGNALPRTAVAFTTADPPDTTPPTVTATTPPPGSTGVPVQSPIQLVFSEAVDRSSAEAAFSASPAVVCASWSWASDVLATCTPSAALAPATAYTVTLGTAALDLAGNPLATPHVFGFSTSAQQDSTHPSVKRVSPDAGSAGASRSTVISVTFSEPVDKATAEAAFAIVSPAGHGSGAFGWSADGKTMTFDPEDSFAFGDVVAWGVSEAVRDLAGNLMRQGQQFGFSVVRQGTATLYGEAALDGDVLSGPSVCTACSSIRVGEYPGGASYRGFLSFDLGALPATTLRISDATLYAYQSAVAGAPYELGALLAQSVYFGTSLTPEAFTTPVLTYDGQRCSQDPVTQLVDCVQGTWDDEYTLSTTAIPGWKSVSVGGKVDRDWAERSTRADRSQLRLEFERDNDLDGVTEFASFVPGDAASNQPYLVVTFEYP